MPGLTKKQEAFAVAYIVTGNASKAYRKSYNAKGMTAKSVNELACRLLKHVKIASRVEELRAPALEATRIDIETWAAETAKYALAKPGLGLKHADKRGYLDMLGRHVGSYKEDNLQQRDSLVLNVEPARPVKR